jgi:HK97 family phage prohead protease
MSKTFERRMGVSNLEFRETSDEAILSGYASTFNQSYDMGWHNEDVDPGAFKRTLGAKPDVRFLINHAGLPLARTTSGTLLLDTDSKGLRPEARLSLEDPDVQSLVPKMRRGDLNQMSFSFRVFDVDGDSWSKDMSQRTLRSLDLNDGDVSVVTYPANPNAMASIRGDGPAIDSVVSAMRTLETRAASPEAIASVLTRALAYFASTDPPSTPDGAAGTRAAADPAECGACDGECCDCTDPDCAGTCCKDCPGNPMRAAQTAKELRGRLLALIG